MQCQESLGNDAEGINVNLTASTLQKPHKSHSINIYKSVPPFELNTDPYIVIIIRTTKKYNEPCDDDEVYIWYLMILLYYIQEKLNTKD